MDALLGGGAIRCGYCNATHHLGQRNENPDREAAAQATAVSESARLERLREQDKSPIQRPASIVQQFGHGDVFPNQIGAVRQQWLESLRLLKSGGIADAERLFHLTLLAAPHLDERPRRAFLEPAVEVLPDARHRQVLRCLLSIDASYAGDLDAARQWLEPCQSRPLDLLMDSAWRLASSMLAAACADGPRILATLGRYPEDVPIASLWEHDATVIRAHGLELTGNAQAAGELLYALLNGHPELIAAQDARRVRSALRLCPRVYDACRSQLLREIDARLRPSASSLKAGPAIVTGLLGLLVLLVGLGLVGLAIGAAIAGWEGWPAITVNAGFWGGMVTLGGAVLLGSAFVMNALRKAHRRMRETGVMTFARALERTGDKATLEVLLAGAPVHFSVSCSSPGTFPCLFDPTVPGASLIAEPPRPKEPAEES